MNAISRSGTSALTALIYIDKPFRWRLRAWLYAGQVVPSAELAQLDFVHVASWNLIRQTGSDWDGNLLFISNFSGDAVEYLTDFADILSTRIVRCFGRGEGFPGARPAPAFVDYVFAHAADSAVYYSAYGDDSTRDVAAAFKVAQSVNRLKASALRKSPNAFAADYERELARVQARNTKTITRPRRAKLTYRALRYPYQMSSLTVVFPVEPGKEEKLGKALAAMAAQVKGSAPNFFVTVLGTHFARFVPLGVPKGGDPGQEPKYLVFSAQVDGRCDNYLERLRVAIEGGKAGADDMKSVLACCRRYPGTEAVRFHEWFDFYTTPGQMMVAEQPLVNVDTVKSTMNIWKTFLTFAFDHQADDPKTLLAAFQGAFLP